MPQPFASVRQVLHHLWAPRLHVGWFEGAADLPGATLAATLRKGAMAGLQAGDSLLEVGCGFGTDAALLAGRYGQRVVASDRALWRLRNAGTAAVTLLCADHGSLPLADARFDIVWASETLSFGPVPVSSLFEAARVARPGGRLVLQETWAAPEAVTAVTRLNGATTLLSPCDWQAVWRSAGLAVECLEDWSQHAARTYGAVLAGAEALPPTPAVMTVRRNMAERLRLVRLGSYGCLVAVLRKGG